MASAPPKVDVVFCIYCGLGNPTANKHCWGCGKSLSTRTCSFCSTVNPHHAGYCGACGRQLSS